MDSDETPEPPVPQLATNQLRHPRELEFGRKKDGSLSKMRSHAGNKPVLPQSKLCPHCPAKFTRTTHLNRHLRTHANERLHRCDTCDAQFTRSDLLTRHKKTCSSQYNRIRKSCQSCKESKVKCSGEHPCSKCYSRGKECVYMTNHIKRKTVGPSLDGEDGDFVIRSSTGTSGQHDTYSFQPAQSLAQSAHPNAASESDTTTTAVPATPANNHLSVMYNTDILQPFFSSIFSSVPPLPSITDGGMSSQIPHDFPFNIRLPEFHFLTEIDVYGQTFGSIFARPVSEIGTFLQSCTSANGSSPSEPLPSELQHYLYLFFAAFSVQMPLVHFPSFTVEGKPKILLNAMRACGALFVKTQKASAFITKVLLSAQDVLLQELTQNPNDTQDPVHLVLAVVLLQTIGLFHQKSDQRASSSLYHGLLVAMIRRNELIQKNASWLPGSFADAPPTTLWVHWILNEMMKRALLLSFLHDTCQVIYFALPAVYTTSEVLLHLPCEEALWTARSAEEWLRVLQMPSAYGSMQTRLTGHSMIKTMAAMSATQQFPVCPTALTPFAHFVLVHAILRTLFTVCVDSRLPSSLKTTCLSEIAVEQEVFGIQFCLHAWLASWQSSPDAPVANPSEEPTFLNNALPFYWLAQVSLLAFQEGLAPFELNSADNLNMNARFRLIKHWLTQIRGFLKTNDQTATLFWDELMKVRLQAWQMELSKIPLDDQEGLLAFFPRK